MIYPRWLAQILAKLGGYFWLPCPVCHEQFAGFECGDFGVMDNRFAGQAVCKKTACQSVAQKSEEAQGVFRMVEGASRYYVNTRSSVG